jgi:hypothetical protein
MCGDESWNPNRQPTEAELIAVEQVGTELVCYTLQ